MFEGSAAAGAGHSTIDATVEYSSVQEFFVRSLTLEALRSGQLKGAYSAYSEYLEANYLAGDIYSKFSLYGAFLYPDFQKLLLTFTYSDLTLLDPDPSNSNFNYVAAMRFFRDAFATINSAAVATAASVQEAGPLIDLLAQQLINIRAPKVDTVEKPVNRLEALSAITSRLYEKRSSSSDNFCNAFFNWNAFLSRNLDVGGSHLVFLNRQQVLILILFHIQKIFESKEEKDKKEKEIKEFVETVIDRTDSYDELEPFLSALRDILGYELNLSADFNFKIQILRIKKLEAHSAISELTDYLTPLILAEKAKTDSERDFHRLLELYKHYKMSLNISDAEIEAQLLALASSYKLRSSETLGDVVNLYEKLREVIPSLNVPSIERIISALFQLKLNVGDGDLYVTSLMSEEINAFYIRCCDILSDYDRLQRLGIDDSYLAIPRALIIDQLEIYVKRDTAISSLARIQDLYTQLKRVFGVAENKTFENFIRYLKEKGSLRTDFEIYLASSDHTEEVKKCFGGGIVSSFFCNADQHAAFLNFANFQLRRNKPSIFSTIANDPGLSLLFIRAIFKLDDSYRIKPENVLLAEMLDYIFHGFETKLDNTCRRWLMLSIYQCLTIEDGESTLKMRWLNLCKKYAEYFQSACNKSKKFNTLFGKVWELLILTEAGDSLTLNPATGAGAGVASASTSTISDRDAFSHRPSDASTALSVASSRRDSRTFRFSFSFSGSPSSTSSPTRKPVFNAKTFFASLDDFLALASSTSATSATSFLSASVGVGAGAAAGAGGATSTPS